ncbi:MAG: hypothetical protein JXB49_08630 [Bacteroidales bacterium]|nr:hypothetical protein [Bacteroidales bacterium]
MSTPAKAKILAMYIAFIWFCSPIVEAIYYSTELKRGSYPPESDTVIIPIMQFTISWFLLTPLIVAFVWWLVKHYPGKVSLLSWNREKQFKSYIITTIISIFVICELVFVFKSIARNHIIDVISTLLTIHIALIVRASMVMSYNKKPYIT